MTDIRKLAFVGLASLGLFTIGSVGCSSSSGTGTGGTSGTGTGGTSSGNGGSHTGGSSGTGTGGSSTGTGGAGGAVLGCSMSDPAPTDGVIGLFTGADAGVAAMNGTFTYGSGTPKPTFTISGGAVNVTDTIQTAGGPFYQGFGIYMNGNSAGTDCIDGSSFTGIEFDLSGSLTASCAMVFSINDSEHADPAASTPADPKAGGPAGAYAPQLSITASQITSTAMTIKVPFTGAGSPAFSGGAAKPATAVDPLKLTGVQWQLATPAASDGGAVECDWNISLANVKFYH